MAPGAAYLIAGRGRTAWANKRLLSCALKTGQCVRLMGNKAGIPGSLALAPGGQKLVLIVTKNLGPEGWAHHSPEVLSAWLGGAALWTMGVKGAAPAAVKGAPGGVQAPGWAGGGKRLVYVKDGAVYLTDVPSGDTQKIASGAQAGLPATVPYYGHVDLSASYAFWPAPAQP